jgi:nitric oxide reductase NorE protein
MTQQVLTPSAKRAHAADKRAPGEAGVWVFILTEMVIFTALFGVILWYRAHNPKVFAEGQALLNQPLGLINTVVLIVGSVVVVLAIDAAQHDHYRQASRYLALAMCCGLCFVVIKGTEYLTVMQHGAWIHTNAYWMVFFVITGAHMVHVLVGTATLGLIRPRTSAGLVGPRDRDLFVSATCYWHMVDLLWLILFPLFYLVN